MKTIDSPLPCISVNTQTIRLVHAQTVNTVYSTQGCHERCWHAVSAIIKSVRAMELWAEWDVRFISTGVLNLDDEVRQTLFLLDILKMFISKCYQSTMLPITWNRCFANLTYNFNDVTTLRDSGWYRVWIIHRSNSLMCGLRIACVMSCFILLSLLCYQLYLANRTKQTWYT